MLILAIVALLIYAGSASFGVTELDDIIFIRDFKDYNEDWSNIITSFKRGLFNATTDPYYRPLFMVSMILNYHIAGDIGSFTSYHVINILLHIGAVVLLYRLFLKLTIGEIQAFLLALIFAVLPVLSQAVAWIPGRNDTMLAVFVLSFFLFSIDYSANGKVKDLLLSIIFLLLSFFTKETAVFAPPAASVLLILALGKRWLDRNNLVLYGCWAACFALWLIARSQATSASTAIAPFSQIVHRLPVLLQYLGKVLLPFNLSVFPEQGDTVYYFGVAALVLLGAGIALYGQRNLGIMAAGTLLFLLFLAPAVLVPDDLNKQMFEHRLYLPVIGILLVLSQTIVLNNRLPHRQLTAAIAVLCLGLAVVNYRHQQNFQDPITFWTQAVETSPNSPYANMMLAARLDKSQFARSAQLFRKAYSINPKEKYLNYYYAVMLQTKDSVLQSEKYLMAEKQISDYYECDFYLARVAMEKRDLNAAIAYLESYLKKDPNNHIANQNLFLLYRDTNQKEKAEAQAKRMQQMPQN